MTVWFATQSSGASRIFAQQSGGGRAGRHARRPVRADRPVDLCPAAVERHVLWVIDAEQPTGICRTGASTPCWHINQLIYNQLIYNQWCVIQRTAGPERHDFQRVSA